MNSEQTFIVHTVNVEQENVLKTLFKALKIKFEITDKKTYNPAFVAKIKKSKEEFEAGDFIHVEKENLQQFLGLQ